MQEGPSSGGNDVTGTGVNEDADPTVLASVLHLLFHSSGAQFLLLRDDFIDMPSGGLLKAHASYRCTLPEF